MSIKQFTKEHNNRERVEGELVKTVLYSLITSLVILGILYYVKLKSIDGFMDKYGFYLFFAAISYSLIIAAIRQVRAYKEFACMTGMMIGMTTGMIAGFLAGFYVGATNGMFIGSVFGMAVGIVLGVWMGKCCGIMGIMEGIMAGFMGSLMGGMTAIMLLNDNLKIATVIIFIISSIILIALNYMVYLEMKENERQLKEDHTLTIFITIILIAITAWLMIFGPRSSLFT